MNLISRLGLLGTAITLGAVLALAAVVTTSNTPAHANSSPDLEVGTPSVDDSSPYTGASFTLSATVTNAGDGESAATTLRYYRSTDSTITMSDTELGTDAVGALAAAGTSDQSIDLTAPSTAGTYYYGACVDTVAGESDTTDNCSTAVTVTVKARPDLTLRVGHEYAVPFGPGASFTLSATVTNDGDGQSAATTLRYYRSTDATITASDTELDTDAVGALAAAGTSAQSIDLTAPSTSGTYHYGACVDSVAGESDTTDNCAGITLRVPVTSPNLVAWLESVNDASPAPGGSITLSATVANWGTRGAEATTLRYYYTTKSPWILTPSSDTEVGTEAVGALASAGTSDQSTVLTAPSTLGTYYYYACVDTVTDESDTTDNCQYFDAAVRVTVTNSARGAPSISGTAQVGQTLTASTTGISDPDGLTSVSYSYRWLADDTEIDGATSSTYTVQSTDNGKVIKVRVSFTDDAGNDESLTSTGTAAVNSATGAPTISGTAQVGQTLTASTSGISDPDGLTNVTYSYQWLADDTEIDGATSSTYMVQSSDNGKVIKVQVTFTDDAGNDESLTSAATAAVVMGGL